MPKELELIPAFKDGETILVQRTVAGQNVLMTVVVRDPSAIGPSWMRLNAEMGTWGVSSYADGRVKNQRDAIDRLSKLLDRAKEFAVDNQNEALIELLFNPSDGTT